jgi:hypothetical protein
MKGYHLDKQDPENQVLLNKSTYLHHENDLFEIFKVENGEFQSKPILVGSLGDYHKPGDKVDIDNAILNYLREDKGTSRVPEDLQKTRFHLNTLSDNRRVDEGDIENWMKNNMNYWSECILGLHESGIPIRPENFEDGMKVYNAKYQNGNTDAYVSLCQAVDDEEILNAENVVEAKYNGETWELNENPEAEIGDFYQEGLTNPFN